MSIFFFGGGGGFDSGGNTMISFIKNGIVAKNKLRNDILTFFDQERAVTVHDKNYCAN